MVNKSQLKTDSSALADKRLIVSVKEARKLLGKKFGHMSDDQIEDIVIKLDLLAQGYIANSSSI